MYEIEIKDINNNPRGTVSVPEAANVGSVSEALVHSAVTGYLANQRQGTHATKTRGLVRGGGKKPFKQKGTGRARQGSTRSPLQRTGGTVFGPQPRDYSVRLPKNMRRAAMHKAFAMKLADGEIAAVDAIKMEKPATGELVKILKNLGLSDKSVLLVLPEKDENVMLSARNIPGVGVIRVTDISAYDIAAFNRILFTADALSMLQKGMPAGEVGAA